MTPFDPAAERVDGMTVNKYLAQQVYYDHKWVTIEWLIGFLGEWVAGEWLLGYVRAGKEIRRP